MAENPYVTIEEMAAMHGVDPMTVRRILWSDQQRDPADRRIPGAVKIGSTFRGEWRIPRDSAQNWQRSARGRKSAI